MSVLAGWSNIIVWGPFSKAMVRRFITYWKFWW
jgi:hypothetical protein